MELVVEYLVIIEKNVSPPFFHICQTTKGFNHFLQSITCDLITKNNELIYKDALTVGYKINIGELSSKAQRFVHMTFTFNGDEHRHPPEDRSDPAASLGGAGSDGKQDHCAGAG